MYVRVYCVPVWCGVTPLQIATRKRDTRMLKILLQWQSDLYREGRVKRGELDYNADVFHLAIDIGAFDVAAILADVGYDLSRVRYLVDWSETPPSSFSGNEIWLQYFRKRATTVQTMFRISLLTIRNFLSGHITDSATQLPLPKLLISAVQMVDTLT